MKQEIIEKIAAIIQDTTFNAAGKKLGPELHNHFLDGANKVLDSIKNDVVFHPTYNY